jgi:spore maturation protein CgeB
MTDSKNDRLLAHFYSTHLREIPDVELGSLYYVDELDELNRSTVSKITYHLLPSFYLKRVNRNIIRSIESFKPDLIWIFKGMEIYPETLNYAKKKGIRLVNYNPDHPFVFAASGSGNAFVKNAIPLYDLHLSYSKEILNDLLEAYQLQGKYLPFGYEINDKIFSRATSGQEIHRACFVGCADAERKRVVQLLLQDGIPVDVYGPGWDKYFKTSALVKVWDGVYNDHFWNVLRSYRLQLNVFRSQNRNSHNMRSFEIPGIGGIMLAPYSDEHVNFFKPGEEAYFFKNDEEIIRKTREILALPARDASAVRQAARERSVRDGYSYKERSKMAYGYFSGLLN